MRALTQREELGGNSANTLGLLAQLGHACAWCGTLANDDAGGRVSQALARAGVSGRFAVRLPGATPFSHICVSRENGSRSILHFRELPELSADQFPMSQVGRFDWIHFEGRNPSETLLMMRAVGELAERPRISLELEKPRQGLEELIELADLLLIGRRFAESHGCATPQSLLSSDWALPNKDVALAWGEQGAWSRPALGESGHCPPLAAAGVVDTIGAGDVFNAGVIHGLMSGSALADAVAFANRLAGFSCSRRGVEGLAAAARAEGVIGPD